MDGLAETSEMGLRAGCSLQTSKKRRRDSVSLQKLPLHVRHADQSFLSLIGLSSARDLASKMRK